MRNLQNNKPKYSGVRHGVLSGLIGAMFLFSPILSWAQAGSDDDKDHPAVKNDYENIDRAMDHMGEALKHWGEAMRHFEQALDSMDREDSGQGMHRGPHRRGHMDQGMRGGGMRGGMGHRGGGMRGMHGMHHGGTAGGEEQCPQPRSTAKAPDELYNQSNPLESSAGNIEQGRLLYQLEAQPTCTMCHGSGDGQGMMGAGLVPPPRNFTCSETMKELPDGQLFWIIANGSPGTGMPAFSGLSDEQIWQLVHYVRSLAE